MPPPVNHRRGWPSAYRIDEVAELSRTRTATPRRRTLRTRAREAFVRFVEARSDEELERVFGPAAQRVFFAGLVRAFDPAMAMGFEGRLEFRLQRPGHDRGEGHGQERSEGHGHDQGEETVWTVDVRDGRARLRPEPAADPAVSLRTGVADFLRLVSGEAHAPTLLLDGRLHIDGDLSMAARIGEMFGGPSPY